MHSFKIENISKDVLYWSYQRAGLTQEQVIGVFPLLEDWLNDTKQPTPSQLKEYAAKVNSPLGFLYLSDPLVESMPFVMYDSENHEYQDKESPHFDLDVYDLTLEIGRRQDWLEDYLAENEIDKCNLVGALNLKASITEAVVKLREMLNIPPRWAFDLKHIEYALEFFTSRLEDAGVFVSFSDRMSNNPARPIKLTQCRGFSLTNKDAPYLYVNSSDIEENQVYTLLDECVHLMLGLSVGHAGALAPIENEEEVFCDKVTKEFLLQTEKIDSLTLPGGKSPKRNYIDLYSYNLKRIGCRFAFHVHNAVLNRLLSYTEAYRLTGLYGSAYQEFMTKLMAEFGFHS